MVTNTPTHTPLEGELAASLIHWILNCSNPLPPTHAPVRERERDSCARGKFSHSPIHGLLLLVLMLVLVLVLMLWPPCGPSLPGSDRHILTLSPGASGDPCWPGYSRTGADSEQEKKKKKKARFFYLLFLSLKGNRQRRRPVGGFSVWTQIWQATSPKITARIVKMWRWGAGCRKRSESRSCGGFQRHVSPLHISDRTPLKKSDTWDILRSSSNTQTECVHPVLDGLLKSTRRMRTNWEQLGNSLGTPSSSPPPAF